MFTGVVAGIVSATLVTVPDPDAPDACSQPEPL
jgi:hypothetical protein